MKINSLFVAVLLMAGVVVAPANAAGDPTIFQAPKLVSFEFTPKDIELQNNPATLKFRLVVSHPVGIFSKSVNVRISKLVDGPTIEYLALLTRQDNPVNSSLKEVTFLGNFPVPANISTGVWSVTANPVKGFSPTGVEGWESESFVPADVRNLVGAENDLLVRQNGDLSFDFQTFAGPSYISLNSVSDGKPLTLTSEKPIFRVGESIQVGDYFQVRVRDVPLLVESQTPTVCASSTSKLTFVTMGFCQYRVYTPKTKDYLAKELVTGNTIKSVRFKPYIYVPEIADQTVSSFPKIISRALVFSWGELVNPIFETPSVCTASGQEINLFSSGLCKFTYSVAANEAQLASDIYTQSFKVKKDGEVLVEPTPTATPTPVATPTPTVKPVVKKTITCVKGKKTIKKTAVSLSLIHI